MIKLKDIISEIEHFKHFDQSKIRWGIEEDNYKFFVRMYIKGYQNPLRRLFVGLDMGISDSNPEWFGGIALSKKNIKQQEGYLILSYVEVAEPKTGFGRALFKKTLEELKKRGYKGLAVYKRDKRSRDAKHLLNKIVSFSDEHYDYINA